MRIDMKKYLSLVLLLSGAVYAAAEVQLLQDLVRDWLNYKARKLALAAEEYEAMASYIENDDLQDDYEEVAEDLEELCEDLSEIEVPEQGLMISLERKDQWDALKKEREALNERKATEIKQYRARDQEPVVVEKDE